MQQDEVTLKALMKEYRIDKMTVSRIAKDNPQVRIYDNRGKPKIGLYDRTFFNVAFHEYKSRRHSVDQSLTRLPAKGIAGNDRPPPVAIEGEPVDHEEEVPALPPPTRGRPPGAGTRRVDRQPAPGEAEPVTVAERAALARLAKAEAEAERSRLKARQEAGELVEREAVRTLVARVATQARQRLESIPGKLARSLVGLSAAEIEAAIRAEIVAGLAELSQIEGPPT